MIWKTLCREAVTLGIVHNYIVDRSVLIMPYLIVYIGRDQKTVKNIVTPNHPSEWFRNATKRIGDSGSTEAITLLWWTEITAEQAELIDPGYRIERDDPVFPGLNY